LERQQVGSRHCVQVELCPGAAVQVTLDDDVYEELQPPEQIPESLAAAELHEGLRIEAEPPGEESECGWNTRAAQPRGRRHCEVSWVRLLDRGHRSSCAIPPTAEVTAADDRDP